MADRIKVRPIHSAWGRIQGWAVERNNTELFFSRNRINALNVGQRLAVIFDG